nr:PQQ-binding-like beta-propeller repeat protein [Alteromonas sp. ASW11-130]
MKRTIILTVLFGSLVGCGGDNMAMTETVNTPNTPPVSSDLPPSTEPSPAKEPEQGSPAVNAVAIKGPLISAPIKVYKIDLKAHDFKGELLASGLTNKQAEVKHLILDNNISDEYLLLSLEADDQTIDLNTNDIPVIKFMQSLITWEQLQNHTQVNITPLTTIATQLALNSSSTEGLTTSFVEDAVNKVKRNLGFGLLDDIDIFTSPAMMNEEAVHTATIEHRASLEAAASLVIEMANMAEINSQIALSTLITDLSDGEFDGKVGAEDLQLYYQNEELLFTVHSQPVKFLPIAGTDKDGDPDTDDPFRIHEIAQVMVKEQAELGNQIEPNDFDSAYTFEMDNYSTDTDGDGIPDGLESDTYNTNPVDADTDKDGLSDGDEIYIYQTDPRNLDSDNDRVDDGFEVRQGFNPLDASDAFQDADGDGYKLVEEYYWGSDALDQNSIPEVKEWHRYQGDDRRSGFINIQSDVSNALVLWEHALSSNELEQGPIPYLSSEIEQVAFSQVVSSEGLAFAVDANNVSDDGSAVVNTDIVALDISTGEVIWRNSIPDTYLLYTPYVSGDFVIINNGTNLQLFNKFNGQLIFSQEFDSFTSRNVVSFGNRIFVPTENKITSVSMNGNIRWERIYTENVSQLFSYNSQLQALTNDVMTISIDSGDMQPIETIGFNLEEQAIDERGNITALSNNFYDDWPYSYGTNGSVNVQNNEILWPLESYYTNRPPIYCFCVSIEPPPFEKIWNEYESISHKSTGLGLLITRASHSILVKNIQNGNELWTWETPDETPIKYNIIFTRTHIFVSTQTHTYAIGLASHEIEWRMEIAGSLSLSKEGILFVSSDAKLTAINVNE